MQKLRKIIRQFIKESVDGLGYREMKIENDKGRATILYGDNGLNDLAKEFGYDNYQEIDDFTDKNTVDRLYKKEAKNSIILIDWRSVEPKSGFGRYVINQIIELAKKLNINTFKINLPSQNAKEILNHYVNKGLLTPVGNPSGLSVAPYHTTFKINF